MNSSVAQVNPHNNALWYLGQSTKIGVSVRNYIKEKIILLSKHAFGNTCRCMHKLCCDCEIFHHRVLTGPIGIRHELLFMRMRKLQLVVP